MSQRAAGGNEAGHVKRLRSTIYTGIRSVWALRIISFVVVLALWAWVSTLYPDFLLPGPSRTGRALYEMLTEGTLMREFLVSMQALLIAFTLAVIAGIGLGLLMGGIHRLEAVIDPYLNALYVTPTVMLIPLFIIWFGIGIEARIAYIFINSYFPILVNTVSGVRQMQGDMEEAAVSFGASRTDVFRKIYFPGAMPMILAGVRLGLGRGITGMIVAEMFLALVGLGYLVVDYGNRLATANVIGMVILVSLFGVASTEGIKALERKLTPWAENRRS